MELKNRFSISAKRMSRSVIRELLKLANKPGLISFSAGLPYPKTFPTQELSTICREILEKEPHIALQYGATEGLSALRELLVSFLREKNIEVSKEELIISSASQQSLDLIGKILIDRGDLVITEEPSYLGALSAFRSYGVRFQTIPMDDQGMRTELLAERLKELSRSAGSGAEYYQNMPKLIYTVPDFQNPSGLTMSLQRRQELLEIAREYDLLIVEDVPYRWLRYSGEDIPMIASLECPAGEAPPAEGRRVLSLFTFSKIFCPGMRLGWIAADTRLINKLVQAKQATDLCTANFNQMIAAEFLRRGLLGDRIQENIKIYRRKLQAMLDALKEFMPSIPGVRWVAPQGGLFLWIILPQELDTDEMFREAIDRRVAYVVGSAFFPNGGGHNTMRLNFSFPSEEEIREGIKRLASLVKSRLSCRNGKSSERVKGHLLHQ